jgi:hypothetical protein
MLYGIICNVCEVFVFVENRFAVISGIYMCINVSIDKVKETCEKGLLRHMYLM